MILAKKYVVPAFVIVSLTATSVLIAKVTIYDTFVYLSFLWFSVFAVISYRSRSKKRLIAFYAAAAILAFGLTEAYWAGWFRLKDRTYLTGTITQAGYYYKPHSILGYGPHSEVQATARKYHGDERLYDVTYTIGVDGLRVGPNIADETAPAILFFGDSFTFGEGVDDHETIPSRVEQISNGKFKTLNFGFHGYGPHQMLATLENGLEKKIIGNHRPYYAIYQALALHVDRCAGRTFWDVSGPRYVLDDEGEAVYAGTFHGSYSKTLWGLINRSNILRRLLSSVWNREPSDVDLFVSIVKKSASILENRYNSRFYVLLWKPKENPFYPMILSKLLKNGMAVIEIDDILPDFSSAKWKYLIKFPVERHPNELAYEIIAQQLVIRLQDGKYERTH